MEPGRIVKKTTRRIEQDAPHGRRLALYLLMAAVGLVFVVVALAALSGAVQVILLLGGIAMAGVGLPLAAGVSRIGFHHSASGNTGLTAEQPAASTETETVEISKGLVEGDMPPKKDQSAADEEKKRGGAAA